jgi:type I restriction enzyme S subunit
MHSRLQGTTQNVGGKSMREGWEYKKLGEIIRPAKVVKNGEKKDLPILSITMHDGIVLQASRFKKTIASVDTSTYKVVKNGQLVIAFPIDEGLIYTQDIVEAGIMSPAYNIWDVDFTNINRQFLTIYLHCPYAMNYYKSKLRGTTMRRRSIPREDLLNMPLPVPSLSTQESIVSELDKINELISLKKEQLKDYDNLAQSIFYDMFGDPVANDKGWEVKKLGEVYKVTSSKRILQQDWQTKGIPFYKVADIVNLINNELVVPAVYIKESTYEELKHKGLVPKGNDILITSRGTIGMCYIVKSSDKFYFQDGMITWLLQKEGCILPQYLKSLFEVKSFLDTMLDKVNISTVAYLSIKQMSNATIPLPPLPLQQAFAKRIEAIEKQKQLISSEIKDLETLLASRMQYWFD